MQVLNIRTQPCRLEFSSQPQMLKLSINNAQASFVSEDAALNIHQAHGSYEMDMSPCRASYGIYDQLGFLRDIAEKGRQDAAKGVVRRVQEGNRLANISSGENAVAAIAEEKNFQSAGTLDWSHLSAPQVEYNAVPAEVNYQPGRVNVNYQAASIDNESQRGTLDITVAQYADVQMWTEGNQVDVSA